MLARNNLRGLGPKVFISYSFRDFGLANQLRDHLVYSGLQVRMEDTDSLVGLQLREVLSQRIAATECVIQLRTPTSNKSDWVEYEFALAEKRCGQRDGFLLLLLVTDEVGLSQQARSFAYLPVPSEGLTEPFLERVVQKALTSIRLIGVNPKCPTLLNDQDIDVAMTSPTDARRVVVDASGFWLNQVDEFASWTNSNPEASWNGIPDVMHHPDLRDSVSWLLELTDVGMCRLLHELQRRMEQKTIDRAAAYGAVHSFYRFLVPGKLRDILVGVSSAGLLTLQDQGRADLGALVANKHDRDRTAPWALHPVLERTYGERELIETELGASESVKDHARVYIPRFLLEPNAEAYLSFGSPPRAHIDDTIWAPFGLPQVAARAVQMRMASDRKNKGYAFSEIESRTAWSLDDYSTMGRP